MKPSTWKDYFILHLDAIGDISPVPYLDISSVKDDSNTDQIISKLTSDNGDSVMIYFSKISKSFQILHNVTNLGNSNSYPESLVVALNGTNTKKASPVFIEVESLVSELEFNAPTNTKILSTGDDEAFENLEAPTSNAVKVKCHPFILLPPCLWEVVVSSKDRSPSNLFFEVKEEILNLKDDWKDFDDLKDLYKECYSILRFIWAASKDIISSVKTEGAVDHRLVSNWSESRHSFCLEGEVVPISKMPKEKNPSPSAPSHEEIENTIKKYSSEALLDSKQKGFEKLHVSCRKLILNASAPNDEIAAGSPCDTCAEFFKQSTHGAAKMHLVKTLRSEPFNCHVEVAQGVVMNIFNGNFLCAYEETPSNFSPFLFPKRPLFIGNPEKECLILQLKETAGKGLSNEDVESALKQGVKLPNSYESLRVTVHNLVGASKYFFSKWSKLPEELTKVHNDIVRSPQIYEALIAQDKFFASKFLFAIDTDIQLWLAECEAKELREEVNDQLIDFSDLLLQVKKRQFEVNLPTAFMSIMTKEPNSKEKDSDLHTYKKRRTDESNDASKVDNNGKIDDWIVPQKAYSEKLRHGPELKKRPKMNNTPLCHRWHSKAYCFENCSNKSTHVASSELPNDLKEGYSKWLKKTLKE